MSLSYTGPDLSGPTTVEIDPDKGATVTYNLRSLTAGTVLSMLSQNNWTIDATASGESELGAKTKIRINGVEQVIHTSCSVPFAAGAPAPLDDPKAIPLLREQVRRSRVNGLKFLIAAKALLEKNPDPKETEVRYWLAGNLCRCTGYLKPVQAVIRAAAMLRGEDLPPISQEGAIPAPPGLFEPPEGDIAPPEEPVGGAPRTLLKTTPMPTMVVSE